MKTIALNMIVGNGDGKLLQRLFSSIDRKVFEQIVLILTSNNEEDQAEVARFATDVGSFEWTSQRYPYGNFAGARNAALALTKTDYVMWLDCDDIFSSDPSDQIKKLKMLAEKNEFDYGTMLYCLEMNRDGKPIKSVVRERIFRRESGIHWENPVHEQLTLDPAMHKRAEINGVIVYHHPVKEVKVSNERNMKILEHEYRLSPRSRTRLMAFYYARELFNFGEREAAIPIFGQVIEDFKTDPVNTLLYETFETLMRYYAYDRTKPNVVLRKETAHIAEGYARLAMSCSSAHAEPLVLLGDIFTQRGDSQNAIASLKTAMQKKFGSGGVQDIDYYEHAPALRLMSIYKDLGEIEQSLWYSRIVLNSVPDDQRALKVRKELVCDLLKECL